jgi:hypothetical protein
MSRKPSYPLQPLQIFSDEVTKINELYWKTSYCYARTAAIISTIASLGNSDSDPRVCNVWPSINEGERRHSTVSISQFRATLDGNLETLRRSSILYVCSAFENALSGFYVLCALYQPKSIAPNWAHAAAPAVCANPTHLSAVIALAQSHTDSTQRRTYKLRGQYTDRIKILSDAFSLGIVETNHAALDGYYSLRNQIAHDQGLNVADSPISSAKQVLASRVQLSEADWKRLLADFSAAIREIDSASSAKIVSDGGVSIALLGWLKKSYPAGGQETLGKLAFDLSNERNASYQPIDLQEACSALSIPTSSEKAVHRRLARLPALGPA